MKVSASTFWIVALVVAVVAVVLVNVYVEVREKRNVEDQFTVFLINRSVRPGERLSERDVEAKAVPQRFGEAFKFAVEPDKDGRPSAIGDTFQRPANSGDVLWYNLFTKSADDDLDHQITDQMRLVALPVNSRMLPGNLQPGMFVDIEAPFSVVDGGSTVLPVMEYVRVLAVGNVSIVDQESTRGGRPRNPSSYRTISIEVEPDQATDLSMIQKIAIGDFELHLRNPADQSTPKIRAGGINPDVLRLIEP